MLDQSGQRVKVESGRVFFFLMTNVSFIGRRNRSRCGISHFSSSFNHPIHLKTPRAELNWVTSGQMRIEFK